MVLGEEETAVQNSTGTAATLVLYPGAARSVLSISEEYDVCLVFSLDIRDAVLLQQRLHCQCIM